MSSRGSPIPRELADPPSSPFQPILARTTAARRPVVRRPAPPRSANSTDAPARSSTPFGEIGKEEDDGDDNSDVLSLLSGTSGWAAGGDEVDEEAAAFLPRVRDLRQIRPIVRKRTVDVVKPAGEAQDGEKKEATAGETAAATSARKQERGPAQDSQASVGARCVPLLFSNPQQVSS